ncbi:MAG: DMT family transporter [Firmicutes bacterium]|nr:DMT family transporter [Bacillota bacterium]
MEKKFAQKPLGILIMALISTALWGSAIPVIKIGYGLFDIASDDVATKMLFAGVRFTLAGLFVIIAVSLMQKKFVHPTKDNYKYAMYMGAVQTGLEYIFFYISLTYLSGVKGTIINSIGNFFAVLLAHFFFSNDKLNVRKVVGCLLGFIGVVICNIGGEGLDLSFNIMGEGFMLAAAMCFAVGSVMTKLYSKYIEPTVLTGYQLLFGGLILLTIGIVTGGKLEFHSLKAVWLLIYLASLSSVAFAVWSVLLKYNPVAKISIYCFLNPLFGILFALILLEGEVFNYLSLISLVLVCMGIYIVNYTKSDKEEKK